MFAVTNRIKAERGHRAEMEELFQRRGGVEEEPGFRSFELWMLMEQADHEEFLVVTRWDTEEAYNAWTRSDSFRRAHSGAPPAFILGSGRIDKFEVSLSVGG